MCQSLLSRVTSRDYVQIYSIPVQNNREMRFLNNFATNTFSVCKTAIANQQREKITFFVEVTNYPGLTE